MGVELLLWGKRVKMRGYFEYTDGWGGVGEDWVVEAQSMVRVLVFHLGKEAEELTVRLGSDGRRHLGGITN